MIKHLIAINTLGESIYCWSLTAEELAEWRETQTEEQRKQNTWLEDLWRRHDAG